MAQLNVCLKKFVWMLCAPEMLETGDACRDHATGHRETVEVGWWWLQLEWRGLRVGVGFKQNHQDLLPDET